MPTDRVEPGIADPSRLADYLCEELGLSRAIQMAMEAAEAVPAELDHDGHSGDLWRQVHRHLVARESGR